MAGDGGCSWAVRLVKWCGVDLRDFAQLLRRNLKEPNLELLWLFVIGARRVSHCAHFLSQRENTQLMVMRTMIMMRRKKDK